LAKATECTSTSTPPHFARTASTEEAMLASSLTSQEKVKSPPSSALMGSTRFWMASLT